MHIQLKKIRMNTFKMIRHNLSKINNNNNTFKCNSSNNNKSHSQATKGIN